MKKVLGILLLLVLLVNVAGYHFMYFFQRLEIRTAMKQRLSQHLNPGESEEFVFSTDEKRSADNPVWKEDDEFEYKGDMYDVIEKKTVDGKIHVRCISDKKETELLNKYLAMSKDDLGNTSHKKAITILKLISGLYTNPEVAVNTTTAVIKPEYFLPYQCDITSYGCDVLTPPPQVS